MDTWFSSAGLFRRLHTRKFNVCGTVRLNREDIPNSLENLKKMKRGETVYRSDGTLLASISQDKKTVKMLSTLHRSTKIAKNIKMV